MKGLTAQPIFNNMGGGGYLEFTLLRVYLALHCSQSVMNTMLSPSHKAFSWPLLQPGHT